VRIIHFDETSSGRVEMKVRCQLSHSCWLQIWLHCESDFLDYAYQIFSQHPLLRWDNAPHYPGIATAPHHFHNEVGHVSTSPLHGEPLDDLPYVLAEVEKWLARH
jgi:hypothetical protein